jgi:hypothetical protein
MHGDFQERELIREKDQQVLARIRTGEGQETQLTRELQKEGGIKVFTR